jgi:serine/threonine-protein kinase
MGEVYLAEQTSLKRKVALKLLNPDLASNDRSLARFKSEAENVARATHANIVQIYMIGHADGVNYIALEYVEGRNLREFIEKKGTPELSLGLHIMAQVSAALQRASELGIIHRDIKPENIMLTKKGEVKVADFGLSRCFAEDSGHISVTSSQVAMGTPLYMSPEQVERKNVDTRTDIYSFGVTCYHMFAGTPPFKGNSPVDVAYQHVHNEPEPLAQIRPDLPAELCAIVQKMMAKKPEERYQTAREILRDINQLREALNLGAVAAISLSSSFLGAATDSLRAVPTQPAIDLSHGVTLPWRVLLIGCVFVALAGGLTLGWYQNLRTPPEKNDNVEKPNGPSSQEKKPISTKEREKELKNRVQEALRPETSIDLGFGLKACVDLGVFYLQQRRLNDADAFFEAIEKAERKVPAYQMLGRLGHAMVLAFKDDPDGSNKAFKTVIAQIEKLESRFGVPKFVKKEAAEQEAYRLVWRENGPIREVVAKALNHNYANDPKGFPPELERYRDPPRPKLSPMP